MFNLKNAVFLSLFLLILPLFASAQELETNQYYINLDKATIARGYTVSAFEGELKLSLVPGILEESTGVEVIKIDEDLNFPWNLQKVSEVYQFEFKNKDAYDNHKPFYIQQVFFYDKNFGQWRPLPTTDFADEKFVRSLIHLPFARLAVFSYPGVLTVGRASWYKHQGGNFAASPDFPKGSVVRVKNKENDKYVDVTINDYGPERNLFPDRAIDLDKVAYSKISSLTSGVIDVELQPLSITNDSRGRVLGISSQGVGPQIDLDSKAAIVFDENEETVYLSKNATSTLPLASLTKLVAIKVFLDTKPTLNQVVEYKVQDENYNYQYCAEWESSKVSLNDGDTLTIEDLLYSALVGSANNAVESLVRVSGMPRDSFIALMNSTVKNWGAVSTNFVEPTGLSPNNVSSALDYAIITKEVFKHPIIQKSSTMPEYRFTTINSQKDHRLYNTNRMIRRNQYDIVGSKTGFLNEAGYCLMTRTKHGDKHLIVVTFGASSRESSFEENEELIQYGLGKMVQ